MDINKDLEQDNQTSPMPPCFDIETAQASRVKCQERWFILFGSNNYLGLNGHPDITQAAASAGETFGTGAGGSRITTGATPLHTELESTLSAFHGTEDTLLFNTGYMANLGVVSAFAGPDWTILIDERSHPSLHEGARISGAHVVVYTSRDMADLEQKLNATTSAQKLIVTNGVFPASGHLAPLQALTQLAKSHGALVAVNDAHGFGVLGLNGRGAASELSVEEDIDLYIGSFSKAIPSIGGYVTGKTSTLNWIRKNANSYLFSAALPASQVAATLKTMEILPFADDRRTRLQNNTHRLKTGLKDLGLTVQEDPTPIVSVHVGTLEDAQRVSKVLAEMDYFVPVCTASFCGDNPGHLRISLMATHTPFEIDGLVKALGEILSKT